MHFAFENEMYAGDVASFIVSINYEEIGTFDVQPGETVKDVSFSFAPTSKIVGSHYAVQLRMDSGHNLKLPLGASTVTFFTPQTGTHRVVRLSGGVRDRGDAGVAGVWIDLLDQNGVSLGGRQTAAVDGERWGIAYAVPEDVDGRYTLKLAARDAVGNAVARQQEVVSLDGMAPDVAVTRSDDDSGLMIGIGDETPILAGTVADVPYPSGRVLAYGFEEPTGSASFDDGSGREMTATCLEGTCPRAGEVGRVGAAAYFGGSDSLVVEDSVVTITATTTETIHAFAPDDATIAFWFNTSSPGPQTIFAATVPGDVSRGLWIGLDADGYLAFTYRPAGTRTVINSPQAANDGLWHHAAAVKDGDQIALLLDGVRVDSASVADGLTGALDIASSGLDRSHHREAVADGCLSDLCRHAR